MEMCLKILVSTPVINKLHGIAGIWGFIMTTSYFPV
jgi:hypothetical protein